MSTQPIDEDALKAGFPITCASCEHLLNAPADAQDCGKLLTCGGPIFGRSFPDYKGPLTPQILEKICLLCGTAKIDFHVLVGLRRFGLCFKHKDVLSRVRAPGAQPTTIVSIPGRLGQI